MDCNQNSMKYISNKSVAKQGRLENIYASKMLQKTDKKKYGNAKGQMLSLGLISDEH